MTAIIAALSAMGAGCKTGGRIRIERYQVSVNGAFVVEVEELADDQQVSVSAASQSSPSVSPAADNRLQAAPVEQGVADGVEVNAPLTGKVLRVLSPGDEVKRAMYC